MRGVMTTMPVVGTDQLVERNTPVGVVYRAAGRRADLLGSDMAPMGASALDDTPDRMAGQALCNAPRRTS
jgi:hypothetical protein